MCTKNNYILRMYIFINLKVSENKITIFISFYLTYFICNVCFLVKIKPPNVEALIFFKTDHYN